MITTKNRFYYALLVSLFYFSYGQELFDPYYMHSIEINFYNPDYNEILEDR